MCVARVFNGGGRHHEGERCPDPAMKGSSLCWTHRDTWRAGLASFEELQSGVRGKVDDGIEAEADRKHG